MKYRLVYTKRAVKDIAKLDPSTEKRIKKALVQYAEVPFDYATKMVHPTLGSYRFRIGDYRVIFDVKGKRVVILRVGHRREIYRG